MNRRARIALGLAAVVAALVVPGAASAHAYLVKTVPSAAGLLNGAPAEVALTYDEAVEPRFALISVTNAAGHRLAAPLACRSADAGRPSARTSPKAGTSSTACDLRRRSPGARRVHVRGRPEPRPRSGVPLPEILPDGDDAPAGHRALDRLHVRHGGDRPARVPAPDRAAGGPARPAGASAASRSRSRSPASARWSRSTSCTRRRRSRLRSPSGRSSRSCGRRPSGAALRFACSPRWRRCCDPRRPAGGAVGDRDRRRHRRARGGGGRARRAGRVGHPAQTSPAVARSTGRTSRWAPPRLLLRRTALALTWPAVVVPRSRTWCFSSGDRPCDRHRRATVIHMPIWWRCGRLDRPGDPRQEPALAAAMALSALNLLRTRSSRRPTTRPPADGAALRFVAVKPS